MAVHYEWADDSKFIMNIHIEEPWMWKEYNDIVDVVMPMISALNHPCATVVNVEKMGRLPKDGNTLQTLLRVEKLMPDNVIASVIVGTPMIVRVFMDILVKLRPSAKTITMFVETMDEAYDKVHARRQELYPDLVD